MVAGLYIDRKEIMHGTIDQMTVGEVEDKLIELRKKLSIPGEFEVIAQDSVEGESSGEPGDNIRQRPSFEGGQIILRVHCP
jgi:hypothetical protein